MSKRTRFLSDDQFAELNNIAPTREEKKKYRIRWPRRPGDILEIQGRVVDETFEGNLIIRPDGSTFKKEDSIF